MQRSLLRFFVASLIGAIAPVALAADPASGERLARRWCASCHLVAPEQPSAQSDAPSFASISAQRRIPEIGGFLKMSHPQMPDMSLTRAEIADLIAYMQTLATPIDPPPPEKHKDDYAPPTRG